MSASQSGVFNVQEFTDLGIPLVGGRLYTLAYGTTTHKTAYTDAAGSIPHTYTSDGLGGQYIALNSRGELPAPLYLSGGSYDLALKTEAGATVWTRRADPVQDVSSAVLASLAASSGSTLSGFIQAGMGASQRTIQDDLRDTVKITQFGASAAASNAVNKAALQAAILAVSNAGGGTVVVPGGINYGYKRTDSTTWPDFTALTNGDVTVIDQGVGNSYTAPAKDGAQVREFFGTKQTPTPGQHDGQGHWFRGNWHPYIYLSNDNPSAAGGNTDPHRASIFFTVNGNNPNLGWRLGQRDVSYSNTGTTDEQYNGFGLSCDGNFVKNGAGWYANSTMIMGVSRYYGTWGFNSYPDQASAYKFYLPTGMPSTQIAFIGDTAAMLPSLSLNANGTGNRFDIYPGSGNVNFQIGVAGSTILKFDSQGHTHIGGAVPSNTRHSINGAFAEGAEILQVYSTSTTDTFSAHSVASFGANAAACAVQFGKNSGTSRSINAGGTINASGADYAEYENNNGLTIAKGQIVGFKSDGTLTLTFSEAVRFGIKSTNPSYVGGDTWAAEDAIGKKPEDEADIPAWAAKVEAARLLVDRIAYSGKVPCNVTGAVAGGYIVAVDNAGEITGEFVADPDFAQYKKSVGRVNRILSDGRCEVAVIVH